MNGPARRLLTAAATAAVAATALSGAAEAKPPKHDHDLGRETLAANDGWAAAEGGTTGGSEATDDNVFTVDTWAELQAAVQGDQPKIVHVEGHIDAWTDADGKPLACDDFNEPGYSWELYLETYDPDVWGWNEPSGPVEEARDRSYDAFREHVLLEPGSNTTIVGSGDASVTHGSFFLNGVDNVIVRNLGVHEAYDCFPAWEGDAWDGEFDNFEVSASTHVWLDHLTITDGGFEDYEAPVIWGSRVEHLDGALDIVRASDLVTVSWSHISNHDKTMLIGNTDSDRYEEWDKLRVTVHHNWFENTSQRAPRLRYGQNHVYNNLYTHDGETSYPYFYSIGVGVHSSIYAENNAFLMAGVDPGAVIGEYGGTDVHIEGSLFNGRRTDLLAAYNEDNPDSPLGGEVGERPELHGKIHPTWAVPWLVKAKAGAGGRC
ncbi:pectate lyase family protein [Glycomyces tarimensis]